MAALRPISQAPELLEQLMPENPQPGDIVKMPEGYSCGEAHDIAVLLNGERVGSATGLRRIENVSNIYEADKVTVYGISLNYGDIIRIENYRYTYVSLMFVEFLGWRGREVYQPYDVTHRADYQILQSLMNSQPGKLTIHEKMCLKQIPKEKGNE